MNGEEIELISAEVKRRFLRGEGPISEIVRDGKMQRFLHGVTMRDLEQRGFYWRVPVQEPFEVTCRPPTDEALSVKLPVVELFFEPLRRRTRDGREQETIMCFTKADALAMLLNPAWLPGQRGAIDYLERQNDALTAILMRAL